MGQYYRPMILKKDFHKEENPIEGFIISYDYNNNGSKLMEHSYIGNSMVRAVESLLYGKYNGYPFVWCGDYADDIDDGKNLYDISRDMDTLPIIKKRRYHKYLINYSKKCYLSLNKATRKAQIHPLPILCSYGNGRSGGDYNGINMDLVGTWAFDCIGVSDTIPHDFNEIKVVFK